MLCRTKLLSWHAPVADVIWKSLVSCDEIPLSLMKPCLAVLSPGYHSDTPQYPWSWALSWLGCPYCGASSVQSLLRCGIWVIPCITSSERLERLMSPDTLGCICVGAVPCSPCPQSQYPSLAWVPGPGTLGTKPHSCPWSPRPAQSGQMTAGPHPGEGPRKAKVYLSQTGGKHILTLLFLRFSELCWNPGVVTICGPLYIFSIFLSLILLIPSPRNFWVNLKLNLKLN